MGRPAEHIVETLNGIVDKIGMECEIISRSIHEAKKIEGSELFSTFAEIEIGATIEGFLRILFTYMPSHVEIVHPENMVMSTADVNTIFNEITMRLHQYDEIAKRIISERNILEEQLRRSGIKPITEQIREREQEEQNKKLKEEQKATRKIKKKGKKTKKKK